MFDKPTSQAQAQADLHQAQADKSVPAATPMDGGLGLIARLSPHMAAVVAALHNPGPSMPTAMRANSSAFETISAQAPRLAQAITSYVHSNLHHGESVDKTIENAARGLFGLPPMTDADETDWLHRHEPLPALAGFTPNPEHPRVGPTVAEYVAMGYLASTYPPVGYKPQSTPAEIADAVKAERLATVA